MANIESAAVEMARNVGRILAGYYGTVMEVEYKGQAKTDPATDADKACQEYIKGEVAAKFPHHGFVGEEDLDPGEAIAPEIVWVVDPLDGTINFLNGLPIYASSIGVMYRGVPIAGAIFLPWPNVNDGVLIHARTDGGAFFLDQSITVFKSDRPESQRLTILPTSFRSVYRLGKQIRGKLGDVRIMGSSVYELAMTAKGTFQYTVMLGPRLWDLVAGAVILREAGGTVLVSHSEKHFGFFGLSAMHWDTLDSFIPNWESGETTLGELYRWSSPVILGDESMVQFVASNLSWQSGAARCLIYFLGKLKHSIRLTRP